MLKRGAPLGRGDILATVEERDNLVATTVAYAQRRADSRSFGILGSVPPFLSASLVATTFDPQHGPAHNSDYRRTPDPRPAQVSRYVLQPTSPSKLPGPRAAVRSGWCPGV